MCLYFMCLINVLIFFLTEKRRDAPNGKLLMIIDKVFMLQFNYCRNVYHGLMLNIYDQIS